MRISDWSSDVCSSDLVVGGQRGHRQHLAGVDVEDDARTADRLQIGDRIAQFAFEHPLHARVDRQRERLTARRGVGQPILEGALDPGDALSLGIGETEDMRSAGEWRIRSEERSVGKEWVSKCRARWWPEQ